MADEKLIKKLQSELQFALSIATAYVKAKGHCEYCGHDLLRDRHGYASAGVDHLLPKDAYPSLANLKRNWVLSCSCCNSTKSNHNVLQDGEDPINMLGNERLELISRARRYIRNKMEKYDDDWKKAMELLSEVWWSSQKK